MDPDIKFIIDEEKKLLGMLEDSKRAAHERVEKHRVSAAAIRDAEFERIASEYNSMTETRLQEIKSQAAGELEELHREQERLLDNFELRKKITGRIVLEILESRA